jgi:hypothetical protein
MQETSEQIQIGRNRFPYRPRLIHAMIAAILIATPTAWWLIAHTKPIPGKYRQGLDYPLYYPSNLPKGYSVDRTSFQLQRKVLIFNIKAPSGKNIAVAEEHIPSGVDLSQHPQNNPAGVTLPDQRDFNTPAGAAEISFWGDKLVSSLVTENTWITLNVSGHTMDDAQKVTQAFTRL